MVLVSRRGWHDANISLNWSTVSFPQITTYIDTQITIYIDTIRVDEDAQPVATVMKVGHIFYDVSITIARNGEQVCSIHSGQPRIRDILLDGLSGWLECPDPGVFQLERSIYEDEFQSLINQQNKIGWHHAFLVRFGWEWCDMQEAHYTSRPTYNSKKCRKGLHWQVAIIGCLWDQWYLLWERRNQDLHGMDARLSALTERRNALRTLREIYNLRDHCEPLARELLMADIRDHEGRSTWHLKTWIAINQSVLRASYQRAKQLAITGVRSLRRYWPGTSSG